MTSLSALFRSFFKIGLFTFGGGYAMIPLIEAEIINRRGWLARDEFMELLTLAQSSPGPIAINTSVFIGYKTRGGAGGADRRRVRPGARGGGPPPYAAPCFRRSSAFWSLRSFSPRCATTSSSTLPSRECDRPSWR